MVMVVILVFLTIGIALQCYYFRKERNLVLQTYVNDSQKIIFRKKNKDLDGTIDQVVFPE